MGAWPFGVIAVVLGIAAAVIGARAGDPVPVVMGGACVLAVVVIRLGRRS
jgi:hypothetical protein